jgi:cytoskeletal protein CcmA (bactofilin family)
MSFNLPSNELTAFLGRGTRFDGKLHFEGRVRIEGSFSGEILSDDTLIIGDGAVVDGDILAATVIIRGGKVKANVRATRSIELHVPAEVSGNLRAPEVSIDKGVHFTGSCSMVPVNPDEGVGSSDEHLRQDGGDA